ARDALRLLPAGLRRAGLHGRVAAPRRTAPPGAQPRAPGRGLARVRRARGDRGPLGLTGHRAPEPVVIATLPRTPPTGTQFPLRRGAQRAVVTEVGAGLRSWSVDGEELLDTFAADAPADSFRGKVLAPWTNRLRDGRYAFAGAERRVALSEPERGCALHGLVLWAAFRPVRRSQDGVT